MKLLAPPLLALVLFTGCSGLGNAWETTKRATIRSGPVAVVAWLATPLGPLAFIFLVIATDTAMDSLVENTELRSGGLKGEEAYKKDMEDENRRLRLTIAELQGRPASTVEIEKPFVPTWVWWMIVGLGLWQIAKLFSKRYRNEFLKFIVNLLTLRIPTAVKSLGKASGMAHTRER